MTTQLATQTDTNPFLALGEAATQRSIVGDILKFQKGDFYAGKDEREVDEGTRLVAVMDEMRIGWVKWENGRPTDQELGRVVDGYRPAVRSSLGDTDQTQWELDNSGQPRDPWQTVIYVVLKEEGGNQFYTFPASSKGARTAVGLLATEYGKHSRMKPDEFPIVELGASSYQHPNKAYGRIKVPVLKVAGWSPKDAALAALSAAAETNDADTDDIDGAPF